MFEGGAPLNSMPGDTAYMLRSKSGSEACRIDQELFLFYKGDMASFSLVAV